MIEILDLKFSNYLSYGANNSLEFTKDKVTILSAENGYGKSSLATVLEDCLFSKNSKGILKGELQNRYLPEKPEATVTFRVGKDFYELTKTSTKATLFCNGDDISGHTATQTHKQIEKIFGMDFSTFTKLIYQSLNSNLDFLKETDANRKKFLIQLLDLDHYNVIEEELKTEAKKLKTDVDNLKGQHSSLVSFSIEVPPGLIEVEVPELLEDNETAHLKHLLSEIANIESRNKKAKDDYARDTKHKTDAISKYDNLVENRRKFLDRLEKHKESKPATVAFDPIELLEMRKRITQLDTTRNSFKATYQKFKAASEHTECPTCKSQLDVTEAANARDSAAQSYKGLGPELTDLNNQLTILLENEKIVKQYQDWSTKLTQLEASIPEEPELPVLTDIEPPVLEPVPDATSLREAIDIIAKKIVENRRKIKEAQIFNAHVLVNNAKAEQAAQQIEQRNSKLVVVTELLKIAEQDYNDYVLLAKSTKELVSYKIESSIKAFEEKINKYLVELSDGRFLLTFKMDTTKLVVRLLADGAEIKISSLSSGEYALLQVATLLAIRANVAKQNINLLILDEVISVLSDHNKDKLVDILLKEPYNSILVSHGYGNPECGLISINKKNNISRLE